MSIEPGQTLSHYRLIEKIGEGGMGLVWRRCRGVTELRLGVAGTTKGEDGMTLDEVKAKLLESGIKINQEQRLGNNTGTQLRCGDGRIFNVYDNGNVQCQGKDIEGSQRWVGGDAPAVRPG